MPLTLMAQADPSGVSLWEKVLAREGIATTLIFGVFVFGLGVAWKVVLPLLKEFMQASIAANKVTVDTMPKLAAGIERAVENTAKLDPIAKQVGELHEKLVNHPSEG